MPIEKTDVRSPNFLNLVKEGAYRFSCLPGQAGKNYGFLSIWDWVNGELLDSHRVGEYLDDYWERRVKACFDKGGWLCHHPEYASSFEGSEEGRCRGGAIFLSCCNRVIAFEGFLQGEEGELASEAVMLFAAVESGWLSPREASNIAEISGNAFFRKMMDVVVVAA